MGFLFISAQKGLLNGKVDVHGNANFCVLNQGNELSKCVGKVGHDLPPEGIVQRTEKPMSASARILHRQSLDDEFVNSSDPYKCRAIMFTKRCVGPLGNRWRGAWNGGRGQVKVR